MVWTLFEKFGSQLIQLVIGIAIARILSPSDYGVIGMTMIFMALANTFMDSGFGSAIIRKKTGQKKITPLVSILTFLCR